jgi:hypothetical protein
VFIPRQCRTDEGFGALCQIHAGTPGECENSLNGPADSRYHGRDLGGAAPQTKPRRRDDYSKVSFIGATTPKFRARRQVADPVALQATRQALDRAGLNAKTGMEVDVGLKWYLLHRSQKHCPSPDQITTPHNVRTIYPVAFPIVSSLSVTANPKAYGHNGIERWRSVTKFEITAKVFTRTITNALCEPRMPVETLSLPMRPLFDDSGCVRAALIAGVVVAVDRWVCAGLHDLRRGRPFDDLPVFGWATVVGWLRTGPIR